MSVKISMRKAVTLQKQDINSAVISYGLSKKFIKTLLPLSVINILHRRINIPSENFKKGGVDDLDYVSFVSGSKNSWIRRYHGWMKGALDLINKENVKEMFLIFEDSGVVKEFYQFKFKYLENEMEHKQQDANELYNATADMLKTINFLGDNEKFPETIEAKIELLVINKFKSPDYVSPYYYIPKEVTFVDKFIQDKSNSKDFIKIGSLNTGFHKLKCFAFGDVVHSFVRCNSEVSSIYASESVCRDITDTNNQNKIQELKNLHKEECNNVTLEQHMINDSMNDNEYNSKANNSPQNVDDIYNKFLSPQHTSVTISNDEDKFEINGEIRSSPVFKCNLCKTSIIQENFLILQCCKCKEFYHSVCNGILENAPQNFKCNICYINSNCTDDINDDKILYEKLQTLSYIRLLVAFCHMFKTAPYEILNYLPLYKHKTLWDTLKDDKIVDIDDTNFSLRYIYTGYGEQNALKKYFNKTSVRIDTPDLFDNTANSSDVLLLEYNDCICKLNVSVLQLRKFLCIECNNYYHLACHGYLDINTVTTNLVCNPCLEKQGKLIDTLYFSKKENKRILVCRLRLSIAYCYYRRELPAIILASCEDDSRDQLLLMLIEIKLINNSGSSQILASDIIIKKIAEIFFMDNTEIINSTELTGTCGDELIDESSSTAFDSLTPVIKRKRYN